MKCYYEVLGVPRDVDDDELKKSYRKLALKWHPDKNLDNPIAAKEQFQLVQQAYEVLSDSHGRAWYDNHREAILKGGIDENYKDDSIDLFPYFSTNCFKGFNDDDDDKGFYTVYRNVFDKLAAEDLEFAAEGEFDDDLAPSFGNSTSSYEDVVHPFYAYWQSYSTKRSFAWLDPFDIRDISNRRVLRLVEKENKKVRDRAKRERNEQVRNLVAFIRKRDKRVQAHAQKLADRAKENARKAEERKLEKLRERQKQLLNHKISDAYKFSNIESELKTIEANLAAEFGEELSGDSDNDSSTMNLDFLQCVACNKLFKTQKAFINHENSKKHKDSVIAMRKIMTAEERLHSNGNEKTENICDEMETSEDELISNSDDDSDESLTENQNMKKKKKRPKFHLDKPQESEPYLFPGPSEESTDKNEDQVDTSEGELISDQELDDEPTINIVTTKGKKNKKKGKNIQISVIDHESNDDEAFDLDVGLSKKQRKKRQVIENLGKKRQNEREKLEEDQQPVQDDESSENVQIKVEEVKTNSKSEKSKGKKAKEARNAQKISSNSKSKGKSQQIEADNELNIKNIDHFCVTCKTEFSSKNKLFDHLRKTGHATHIPNAMKSVRKNARAKKKDQFDSDTD
ncbi:hypothetical protein PV328_009248 [Microctonus aethiopoides]|uniref:DnaJ homolog subfamily C member 21 n=1 Tax=Microctonus aethiopoides TaxID=144406 RepID=A0AA39C5C8_9HYME|nr:hypothetical protein PV328_009248 [Microctonus aethiopoides]